MNTTKIKRRDAAEELLKQMSWDLVGSIALFYRAKDDEELKEFLKTEDECNIEQAGKFFYSPNANCHFFRLTLILDS